MMKARRFTVGTDIGMLGLFEPHGWEKHAADWFASDLTVATAMAAGRLVAWSTAADGGFPVRVGDSHVDRSLPPFTFRCVKGEVVIGSLEAVKGDTIQVKRLALAPGDYVVTVGIDDRDGTYVLRIEPGAAPEPGHLRISSDWRLQSWPPQEEPGLAAPALIRGLLPGEVSDVTPTDAASLLALSEHQQVITLPDPTHPWGLVCAVRALGPGRFRLEGERLVEVVDRPTDGAGGLLTRTRGLTWKHEVQLGEVYPLSCRFLDLKNRVRTTLLAGDTAFDRFRGLKPPSHVAIDRIYGWAVLLDPSGGLRDRVVAAGADEPAMDQIEEWLDTHEG